tara:strand:+ start:2769 stop:4154 length:1386 start_codon:yes stop_codon:yes gene_type:complete
MMIMKKQLLLIITVLIFLPLSAFTQCWQKISAEFDHTLAIKDDGTLWAWGYNQFGMLGDGTTVDKYYPVQIGVDTDWQSISAGSDHSMAIKTDGTLWAWGDNYYGTIGDGTNIQRNAPVQIGTDSDWQFIAAGSYFSVAIKTNGTLWTWGWNSNSRLGDGTTLDKNVPTQIGSDTDWQAVSVGEKHSVALKTNGTLWSWGWNDYGQLGDASFVAKNYPVQIGTDTDWKFTATGYNYSFAIKTNGSLWAWGSNLRGKLGLGPNSGNASNIPIQVGNETSWLVVSGGKDNTTALKTDNTLWAWGSNSGAFGDGTTSISITPKLIGTDSNWASISAGFNFSSALKTDETLYTSGNNANGRLGDGTNTNRSTYDIVNCTTLGFDHVDANNFMIYPNPVANTLFFETPFSSKHQLQLINQLGQQVLQQTSDVSATSLDVSNLSKGLYFLNITSENGEKQTIKFIKN